MFIEQLLHGQAFLALEVDSKDLAILLTDALVQGKGKKAELPYKHGSMYSCPTYFLLL